MDRTATSSGSPSGDGRPVNGLTAARPSYRPRNCTPLRVGWIALALLLAACGTRPTATPAPTATRVPPTLPPFATRLPAVTVTLAPSATPTDWRGALVFDDEFERGPLDLLHWQTEYWWGRTNPPEAQYYAPDAFDFKDGLLRIKAERRTVRDRPYTSGLISSDGRFTFTYGYAEIRARVPEGKGLWPAFWLTADAENVKNWAEIDVMELLGDQPRRVYMTMHYKDAAGQHRSDQGKFEGPAFAEGFHTFAVDWSPAAVVWYVDDVERFRVTHDVPDMPMYVIANLAVGGEWPGYPDATTPFPALFDVDYIRVYKR